MAFAIRDFRSIVAGMINVVRGTNKQLTDFNVGSITRTLLEAPSAEIEQVYIQYINGLVEAIPTAVYRAFEFERLGAVAAAGPVTISADPAPDSPLTIPAGTLFATAAGRQYELTEAVVFEAGESERTGLVVALTAGSVGNTLADTITAWASPPAGFAVTNPAPLTGGRDEESDAERKARFAAFIRALSRGTRAAIEYGARQARTTDADGTVIERVRHVGLIEEVPGKVDAYIHNGQGGTSPELLADAQRIIDGYNDPETGDRVPGYRAAGVRVIVQAMDEIEVTVIAHVLLNDGYAQNDVQAEMARELITLLSSLRAGDVLYYATLAGRLSRVPGVQSLDLIAPDGNISAPARTLLIPGSVTVQAL